MMISSPSALVPAITAGGALGDTFKMSEKAGERKKQLADNETHHKHSETGTNATIPDGERLETLFSSFQKDRAERNEKAGGKANDGKQARKLRMEEAKVRALNRNGRVDFSIQEYVPHLRSFTT